MHPLKTISDFLRKRKKIYIYGTGVYGKTCLHTAHEIGVNPVGFLTSSGDETECEGVPVYRAADMLPLLSASDGVILALKEEFRREIEVSLQGTKSEILSLEDNEWRNLRYRDFFRLVEELSEEYPCAPYQGPLSWQEILVVRLDLLGDMVWTTPFLRELRRNIPSAHITLVLNQALVSLFQNCPYVDCCIPYEFSEADLGYDYNKIKEKARQFVKENFNTRRFDVVFLPRNIFSFNCLANLFIAAFCGVPVRIGWIDARDSSLNQTSLCKIGKFVSRIFVNREYQHEVVRIFGLLHICGLPASDMRMELWPRREETDWAQARLSKMAGRVYIAIGLSGSQPVRSWKVDYFKLLFRRIILRYNNKVFFVLFGGKDIKWMKEAFREEKNCVDLIGETDLAQATAAIGECDFYFGVDTGLLHVAAAMERPAIVMSTCLPEGIKKADCSPVRCGAWGVTNINLYPPHGVDSCCEKAGYCVKNYAHCITAISVDDAERAVVKMITQLGLDKNLSEFE